MQDGNATRRKIYGSHRPRSICGAYRRFTNTLIENGHFLCVYARASKEITILQGVYADRNQNLCMRRKKICNRPNRICAYVNPQMHSKFKCIRSLPNAIFLVSTAQTHLVNNSNPQMHNYAFGDFLPKSPYAFKTQMHLVSDWHFTHMHLVSAISPLAFGYRSTLKAECIW
jgi:hypothetical protein